MDGSISNNLYKPLAVTTIIFIVLSLTPLGGVYIFCFITATLSLGTGCIYHEENMPEGVDEVTLTTLVWTATSLIYFYMAFFVAV